MNRKMLCLTAAVILTLALPGCKPNPQNTWADTEAGKVYYGADRNAVTGWQEIDGQRYYFAGDGTLYSGWLAEGDRHYYIMEDGTPATLWQTLGDSRYYFGTDGIMVHGWQTVDGTLRCFTPEGILASGWLEEDGAVFYLNEEGIPVTGECTVDGTPYYFREDGTLHTGWLESDGCARYYAEDGTPVYGWITLEENRYHFEDDGTATTGWYEEGEYRYYFHEDGTAAVGETLIDGKTYHFTPDGIQLWLVNPWYYLPEDYEVTLVPSEGGFRVAEFCLEPLLQMLADCRAAGLNPMICSGYRNYWDQLSLYQDMIASMGSAAAASTIVAVPNTSEHQLGLAVDIVTPNNQTLNRAQAETRVQQWLMEHCWDYGFILRYPDGTTEITGIIYEPWHYRYVGIPVAKALQENGLTLEEYLGAVHSDN